MVEEFSRNISSRTIGLEGLKQGNNIYLEGNYILWHTDRRFTDDYFYCP